MDRILYAYPIQELEQKSLSERQYEVSRATVVIPPVLFPLSLAEARKQCEISPSDTAHDDQLTLLMQAALDQWENDTDTATLTQTLSVTVPEFIDKIPLPKRPIQSIVSVQYLDSAGATQTLAASVYSFDAPGRSVRLAYEQTWPDTAEIWNAVTITYLAGFTAAALVPAIYKQAMRLLIGHYFENRDMLMGDAMQSLAAYEHLVRRFQRSTYP